MHPWHDSRDLFKQPGHIRRWTNIPERHAQKLVPRISVMPNSRIVHRDKRERLAIIDPHWMRITLEQQAIAFLTLVKAVVGRGWHIFVGTTACQSGRSCELAIV